MTNRLLPALAATLLLLLSACAPGPVRDEGPEPSEYGIAPAPPADADPEDYPRRAEDISGPAVLALLSQATNERRYGRPQQAVAVLERALRIEPRNPFVWQALALAQLEQERPQQAEVAAQKSNSLARGNPHVELQNWELIAEARQAQGDTAGAERARARAAALARTVE